jgi:hypothetical protein
MDTANRWANGEDAVSTKRNRSPEEEPPRYNNNQQRRRYREYEGSRQVSARFHGNSEQRDDYHKNSEYKGEKRDTKTQTEQNIDQDLRENTSRQRIRSTVHARCISS